MTKTVTANSRRSGRARDLLRGLLWISPWMLGCALFTLGPIALSLWYSLTDYGLLDSPVFVGLENYRELASDPMVAAAVSNTLRYALASALGGTLLALIIAALLQRSLRGTELVRALVFMPTLVPVISAMVCWSWLYNGKFGLINAALGWIGIQGPNWLGERSTALPAMVFMSFWTIGSPMLVCAAALRDVPRSLYEAADLDGLVGPRRFLTITVPLISPALVFNAVMALIWSLQLFAPPLVMTRGGPENSTISYSMYVYTAAFSYGRMGYASALAWLQVLGTLALALTLLWAGRRWAYVRGG